MRLGRTSLSECIISLFSRVGMFFKCVAILNIEKPEAEGKEELIRVKKKLFSRLFQLSFCLVNVILGLHVWPLEYLVCFTMEPSQMDYKHCVVT